ncbi:hypothetical protein VTJ83DRAFT_2424 [Remersonia thermophila]|uniref:Uncharacterized protein n=1 Tax=Remersonia thermophila TaxID=72144 RepID=A0ABR4DJB3_9PEZI
MPAATTTTRQRRTARSARYFADSDSDIEYQAYNARLKQASTARTRLREAKQTRDRQRAALAAAYEASLDQTVARIQSSISKLVDLRSALLTRHLRLLRHAMDRRDNVVAQIVRRLVEHRRRVLNLAVRLAALYGARGEDAAAVLRDLRGVDSLGQAGGAVLSDVNTADGDGGGSGGGQRV